MWPQAGPASQALPPYGVGNGRDSQTTPSLKAYGKAALISVYSDSKLVKRDLNASICWRVWFCPLNRIA